MSKDKTAGVAEAIGRAGGRGFAEGAGEYVPRLLDEQIGPFLSRLRKELPLTTRESIREAVGELKDTGRAALRSASVPVGVGALAGAVTSEPEDLGHGVARGAVGGLAGGMLGSAWGGGRLPVAAGGLLGGALGGATTRKTQERDPMTTSKYAGVTIDWYDDQGATLKAMFPSIDALPDFIKEADVRPMEKLANEDFALVAIDSGNVMRKFACHDPGTTAMSVIYFMEHGDKLPEVAQKTAAVNLVEACQRFDLRPPELLTKTALLGLGAEISGLGVPSLVGYHLAKPEGLRMAQAEEPRPTGVRGKDVAGAAFIPGYIGYQLGQRKAYDEEMAKKTAGIKERLVPAAERLAGGMERAEARMKDWAKKSPSKGSQLGAAGLIGGTAMLGASGLRERKMEKVSFGLSYDPKNLTPLGKKAVKHAIRRGAATSPYDLDDVGFVEAILDYEGKTGKKFPNKAYLKKTAQVVDITGQRPTPVVKVANSSNPDDYAVVLPDGSRHYPIHTWDLVKKAEVYYQDEHGRMQPEIRRQYAVKLAHKASAMGYPLDPEILDAGAVDWAPSNHLKEAVEMRKIACPPGEERMFLDELYEKHASMEPETYAEVLRRFDVKNGLDKGWDHIVLDPWASTFSNVKIAEVVWEDGADRVTHDELVSLSANHLKRLRQVLTEGMCKEFVKDPLGIFESMPMPQKRIIARLATDHREYSEITQAGE